MPEHLRNRDAFTVPVLYSVCCVLTAYLETGFGARGESAEVFAPIVNFVAMSLGYRQGAARHTRDAGFHNRQLVYPVTALPSSCTHGRRNEGRALSVIIETP